MKTDPLWQSNEDGLIGLYQKLDGLMDDPSFDPEIPIRILEYVSYFCIALLAQTLTSSLLTATLTRERIQTFSSKKCAPVDLKRPNKSSQRCSRLQYVT